MKTPIFIVSSGRSGTLAMTEALRLYDNVEAHHEYMVNYIQPTAFQYYMRLSGFDETVETLETIYGAAVAYCDKELWVDSSNKASWLIAPLTQLFPDAKFVWLVRDGRKVVSSYYHKLADECYDDQSVFWMYNWLRNNGMMPPPEKKYWWPLPPYHLAQSRFQLIAWHWNTINAWIDEQICWVPSERRFSIRLEDLVQQRTELESLLDFLELPWKQEVWDKLQITTNVGVPKDHKLTTEQLEVFWKECRPMMQRFGYDTTKEYTMTYGFQPQKWGVE